MYTNIASKNAFPSDKGVRWFSFFPLGGTHAEEVREPLG